MSGSAFPRMTERQRTGCGLLLVVALGIFGFLVLADQINDLRARVAALEGGL